MHDITLLSCKSGEPFANQILISLNKLLSSDNFQIILTPTQETRFANDTARNSIQDYFYVSIDSWNESYYSTKLLGAGTDGNRHWNYIDEDTKK